MANSRVTHSDEKKEENDKMLLWVYVILCELISKYCKNMFCTIKINFISKGNISLKLIC